MASAPSASAPMVDTSQCERLICSLLVVGKRARTVRRRRDIAANACLLLAHARRFQRGFNANALRLFLTAARAQAAFATRDVHRRREDDERTDPGPRVDG